MAQTEGPYRAVEVWASAEQAYQDHIRSLWPELANALDGLTNWASTVVTSPSSVRVPTVAPAAPRRRAGTGSVAPSGESVTGPTSNRLHAVQLPLDLGLGDEK